MGIRLNSGSRPQSLEGVFHCIYSIGFLSLRSRSRIRIGPIPPLLAWPTCFLSNLALKPWTFSTFKPAVCRETGRRVRL